MPHLLEAFLLHTSRKHHEAVKRSGFTLLHMDVTTGAEDRLAEVLRWGPDLEAPANWGRQHCTWLHPTATSA